MAETAKYFARKPFGDLEAQYPTARPRPSGPAASCACDRAECEECGTRIANRVMKPASTLPPTAAAPSAPKPTAKARVLAAHPNAVVVRSFGDKEVRFIVSVLGKFFYPLSDKTKWFESEDAAWEDAAANLQTDASPAPEPSRKAQEAPAEAQEQPRRKLQPWVEVKEESEYRRAAKQIEGRALAFLAAHPNSLPTDFMECDQLTQQMALNAANARITELEKMLQLADMLFLERQKEDEANAR